MSDDNKRPPHPKNWPVTVENHNDYITQRFEERVCFELAHTHLCDAIRNNEQNPSDQQITAVTPLKFDSDPEDEEEPSTKRARLENPSANRIWDPEAIKSIDRIIFYDSIYIPLERAEDSEEDLVQLEHVRTVFNFEGGLRTNHLIIPGQMKFQDIPDILFCRKISDQLCNNVGKIILPIKKLKLVIFKERI
ncbi:hypothetical protein L5515_010307 [Caenorhabditis briggsae]|uniref:Uncharacterized protein n=1 Tax=Caenorhabditis briggsae TaxID=6238 RepID=A0AAE9JFS4_CAEBR|nr:hypothetical protein L5515_010307 [Caenorhabditis briggsae]